MCTLRCFPFVSVWHIYAAFNQMVSQFWWFDRERARIYVHIHWRLRIVRRDRIYIYMHLCECGCVCVRGVYTYLSVAERFDILVRAEWFFFLLFQNVEIPRINVCLLTCMHTSRQCRCVSECKRANFFFCVIYFNFSRSFFHFKLFGKWNDGAIYIGEGG